MRIIPIFLFLLILFSSAAYSAEIAFIPYRMSHSTEKYSSSDGRDYASLLSIYASVQKEADVVSENQLFLDMEKTGMKAGGVITQEHLALLGRTRFLDYIVTGTLYKSSEGFSASSILYSVNAGKVIINTRVSSDTLTGLAEKDARELLVLMKDKKAAEKNTYDFVFAIDLSYNMRSSWEGIKDSIQFLSSEFIDRRGCDTRIYILTFSGTVGRMKTFVSDNSALEIRKWLSGLYPAGEETGRNFTEAMKYSARNIRWRKKALKRMIVISGTERDHFKMSKDYPLRLAGKGVVIDTVSAGRAGEKNLSSLGRLAEAGRGKHYSVSYHQQVFDSEGRAIHLFMERSRIFKTGIYPAEWKKGLFQKSPFDRGFAEPVNYLSEVRSGSRAIYPDEISSVFSDSENVTLLRKKVVENNLVEIMRSVSSSISADDDKQKQGRAMLSGNGVSFWADIPDKEWLDFYESMKISGSMFWLGVRIREDDKELYGISILPVISVKPGDNVPGLIRSDISSIIKNHSLYRKRGFLKPPVWFVKLKVHEIKNELQKNDVRGGLE